MPRHLRTAESRFPPDRDQTLLGCQQVQDGWARGHIPITPCVPTGVTWSSGLRRPVAYLGHFASSVASCWHGTETDLSARTGTTRDGPMSRSRRKAPKFARSSPPVLVSRVGVTRKARGKVGRQGSSYPFECQPLRDLRNAKQPRSGCVRSADNPDVLLQVQRTARLLRCEAAIASGPAQDASVSVHLKFTLRRYSLSTSRLDVRPGIRNRRLVAA